MVVWSNRVILAANVAWFGKKWSLIVLPDRQPLGNGKSTSALERFGSLGILLVWRSVRTIWKCRVGSGEGTGFFKTLGERVGLDCSSDSGTGKGGKEGRKGRDAAAAAAAGAQ